MTAVRNLVVATALLLLAFGAAPAGAQSSGTSACPSSGQAPTQYPPKQCGVAADRSEVAAGGTIKLTGNCPSGTQTVSFRLVPGNANLGTATPDSNGNYTKTVTIPAGTAPGDYQITASCEGVLGAGQVRTVAIKVLAAGATAGAAGATALPRTGAATALPMTGVGVGLVAIGALAVLAARRRRDESAATD